MFLRTFWTTLITALITAPLASGRIHSLAGRQPCPSNPMDIVMNIIVPGASADVSTRRLIVRIGLPKLLDKQGRVLP
jgi:hypothetical protein